VEYELGWVAGTRFTSACTQVGMIVEVQLSRVYVAPEIMTTKMAVKTKIMASW